MESLETLKRNMEIMMPYGSGSFYSAFIESSNTDSQSLSNNNEISNLLIDINNRYGMSLTTFQMDHIFQIFMTFSNIQDEIEPDRLTSFEYFLNEDDEFLIYRKSGLGLTNIIIHDEECIAFSFIGKNPGERELIFLDDDIDYEKLAYKFFAK